ncbi:hypothetical protein JHK85_011257 [Glycine max]|nr:hypothetical protein JHK85_011257 [Glycine max]
MPTWWGKKSSKTKDQQHQQQQDHPHGAAATTTLLHFNFIKPKPSKSFDDVVRNSPRASRDFGSSAAVDQGLPLPRPSVFSTQSFAIDQGLVFGSASVSGSSVSSSGSYDDHPQINASRGQGDMKFLVRSKSPGPGSRGPTSPTSPLHPKLLGLSLDSPTGRQEGECHPLPLPPGSPTSPSSSLPSMRANGMTEHTTSNLSKWKKGKLLGRGTFGHVYLGFNSDSGQLSAIKEVRVVCDDQSSKECLKQLNQEIHLLSQLSHPNIVQYYGSDLGEETLSVYLEYVSGGSIHKLLQEYGAFKEPVIQNYTRQIVSGLSYLHGRNTVHRDIKGANILVDPNGEIKLADFGMAKHPVLDHSNRTSLTSLDGDYATKPVPVTSRAERSPRDNTRMITSLPVSPCSSPLRQYEPAHKSCFLSPPHPTYTLMGQNTLPSYPVRSNATFTLDPFQETSFYKAHTPGGSPRRLI